MAHKCCRGIELTSFPPKMTVDSRNSAEPRPASIRVSLLTSSTLMGSCCPSCPVGVDGGRPGPAALAGVRREAQDGIGKSRIVRWRSSCRKMDPETFEKTHRHGTGNRPLVRPSLCSCVSGSLVPGFGPKLGWGDQSGGQQIAGGGWSLCKSPMWFPSAHRRQDGK